MSWAGKPVVVESLVKTYAVPGSAGVTAVRGVSFTVERGECFGLLGPNGAGKSTTLECLTGFFPPTSGRVLIEGHDVHHAPKQARKHLGICHQEDTLDTDFTVLDQLVRHGSFFRMRPAEAADRAKHLLALFKLEDKSTVGVDKLSGGMRRRLQVARALMSSPKVLLLDEPTTGLDPDARRTLWDVFADCRKQGVAVLLSTHYMEEAERLCDRIAVLHQGKILSVDSPKNLIQSHIGTNPIREEIRPGVTWERPPNLEDVFMKLAGSRLE